MKKVMLLGGSNFQIPSIKKANELGYYTVTCDYYPNNPGHTYADEYYNVSTTNKEAVLKLAKKIKVDGVVCYASDPAAPTAAYVCEKLGLYSSPYESVNILSNKDLFREYLNKNQFNVPKAKGYSEISQVIDDFNEYKLPVMVKPVDSSGSKGVSKIDSVENLNKAFDYALSFSRAKRVIIEEYVNKKGYQIAGDGFSVDGKLVFSAFANEHFNINTENPFVPIGESWPYHRSKMIQNKVHMEVQRLLTLLNMKTGAYNYDIRVNDYDDVYLMEIGPRNGGNLIPQVIKCATGVDLVEYTIKAAMGEDCTDLKMNEINGYWSCYMIHTETGGILKDIWIDDDFYNNNVVEYDIYYKVGDYVPAFKGSNGTLGTMILKYESMDEMLEKMDNMDKWVNIII